MQNVIKVHCLALTKNAAAFISSLLNKSLAFILLLKEIIPKGKKSIVAIIESNIHLFIFFLSIVFIIIFIKLKFHLNCKVSYFFSNDL